MGTKDKDGLLTETELEMMGALWRLGGGTVHEVMELLPADRKLAYTSVSTMLRILEQKEFVKAQRVGRGNRYVPRVAKKDYEFRSLNHLRERVFEGASTDLVRCLVESGQISAEERREIASLLSFKESK